jgi:hypothetical protein
MASARSVMDMESSSGSMELTMKATGSSIKLRGRELSGMQREMFTEENLRTIWPTVTESIHILTDLATRVNSKMTSKKVKEKRSGLMVQNTLVNIIME